MSEPAPSELEPGSPGEDERAAAGAGEADTASEGDREGAAAAAEASKGAGVAEADAAGESARADAEAREGAGRPASIQARARRARLAAIPALLLAALAVWEAVAAQRAGASVPDDEAWARAAALVRADHHPGDLIVFAPDWIDPVGRLHLGDLISLDDAARMDAARYARIWELSIRGARSRDTAGLAPAETRAEGGVTVRRFERAPAEVLADLRDKLSGARTDGAPARPPAVELAEVGFAPRRCILVVPRAGAPARITFPALPAGELVGYVGIADVFTRREERRPGRLAVEVGSQIVAAAAPGVDDGWVRFSARIPGGDVSFVASSDAPNRQLCFAAEVRR